jgi:membrane protein YqaA with SNARE-associated domain
MTGFLDLFLNFVLSFGIAGIVVLAVLDSSFFFFAPFALDAVLILLISRHRDWMPIYAGAAIVGSIAGATLTYFLMKKISEETLAKKISPRTFTMVKRKMEKNGFAGLMIGALLPPPFPFTPFVIAAGMSQLSKKTTFGAITIGRSVRYLAEGVLALVLGKQILNLLEWQPFKIAMVGLFALAFVGTAISIYKWVKR